MATQRESIVPDVSSYGPQVRPIGGVGGNRKDFSSMFKASSIASNPTDPKSAFDPLSTLKEITDDKCPKGKKLVNGKCVDEKPSATEEETTKEVNVDDPIYAANTGSGMGGIHSQEMDDNELDNLIDRMGGGANNLSIPITQQDQKAAVDQNLLNLQYPDWESGPIKLRRQRRRKIYGRRRKRQ